jgi:tellurite resistance protein
LPLVPLIQMAWAEGGVTPAEREVILRFARSLGIEPGSDADKQLTQWLTTRPGDALFASAGRLVRAMLDSGAEQTADLSADDLVKQSEAIAAASGGIFGIGRMSPEEKALLTKIAGDLKGRKS